MDEQELISMLKSAYMVYSELKNERIAEDSESGQIFYSGAMAAIRAMLERLGVYVEE